jgi:uncharacterized protein (TIGR02246 family)
MTASKSATPSTGSARKPAAAKAGTARKPATSNGGTAARPAARSTGPSAADQAAIAAVPARMVAAWAAHDADAFADLFTDDGTLMLPGLYQKGKDNIREYMAKAYAGPYQGTRVTGAPIDIKPLQAGAVALITRGGVIPAGQTELPDSAAIQASWILVKRNRKWLLAVYQNCPVNPAA